MRQSSPSCLAIDEAHRLVAIKDRHGEIEAALRLRRIGLEFVGEAEQFGEAPPAEHQIVERWHQADGLVPAAAAGLERRRDRISGRDSDALFRLPASRPSRSRHRSSASAMSRLRHRHAAAPGADMVRDALGQLPRRRDLQARPAPIARRRICAASGNRRSAPAVPAPRVR